MTAENGAESYNARVLRKLKRSLEKDPCSDLSLVLPESYSKRLKLKKEQGTAGPSDRYED